MITFRYQASIFKMLIAFIIYNLKLKYCIPKKHDYQN